MILKLICAHLSNIEDVCVFLKGRFQGFSQYSWEFVHHWHKKIAVELHIAVHHTVVMINKMLENC